MNGVFQYEASFVCVSVKPSRPEKHLKSLLNDFV